MRPAFGSTRLPHPGQPPAPLFGASRGPAPRRPAPLPARSTHRAPRAPPPRPPPAPPLPSLGGLQDAAAAVRALPPLRGWRQAPASRAPAAPRAASALPPARQGACADGRPGPTAERARGTLLGSRAAAGKRRWRKTAGGGGQAGEGQDNGKEGAVWRTWDGLLELAAAQACSFPGNFKR